MGQPVVHFEVVGKDPDKLKSFYSELAGWSYDSPPPGGPTDYPSSRARATRTPRASASAAVSAAVPRATTATSPSTSRCRTSAPRSTRPSQLGGTKVMGPDSPVEGLTIGLFNDPEGHLVGLVDRPD